MISTARARGDVAAPLLAAGCLALSARSVAPISIVATALVGVLGFVAWPVAARRAPAVRWVAVTAAGCAVMAATLWIGDAGRPVVSAIGVLGLAVAAVAEEAFFRRAMYGWLERHGPALAIGVAALTFGLIHVPVYGWSVLGLDVAAGVLFGWQRWAAGTWTAAAATHLFANLVVLL